MPNRDQRARTAAETVAIAQGGAYLAPSGASISIHDAVQLAIHQTQLITPGQHRSLRSRATTATSQHNFQTRFEVQNQTTLAAAHERVTQYGPDRVAALNFASAKNPGGGFLTGSQAQEESLARATALYSSLQTQPAYYDANRRAPSPLYTDHMIISPQVPVFRDDDDQLLEEPWALTIITAPAPNARAISLNKPHDLAQIEPTFRRRIEQLLALAIAFDKTALVLGAWGCGVFANDPATVAGMFAEFLLPPGPFATAFEHVTFAILDRQGDTLSAFAEVFSHPESSSSA
jgi:uncharacterized protein (TIGR02452 family)